MSIQSSINQALASLQSMAFQSNISKELKYKQKYRGLQLENKEKELKNRYEEEELTRAQTEYYQGLNKEREGKDAVENEKYLNEMLNPYAVGSTVAANFAEQRLKAEQERLSRNTLRKEDK